MLVTMFGLGLLILTTTVPGYADDFFTSSPGIRRVEESKPAYFSWSILGEIAEATEIHYYYGNQKMCSVVNGDIRFYTAFDVNSISCYVNATFTLRATNPDFTNSSFSIQVIFHDNTHNDSNALLFLYRELTLTIDAPANITEGDTINITCGASSTSLPAAHRPTITFSWVLLSEIKMADSSETDSDFTIGGADNGTLTIRNVQHMHEDFTCIAKEIGSPLSTKKTFQINVKECVDCDDAAKEGKQKKPITLSELHKGLIIGGVIAVVFFILISVIIYLCWERKHRPDRHKRRSDAVRHSLVGRSWTLQRGKNGIGGKQKQRHDSVQSESDSEHFYSEIRQSHIRSEEPEVVPALPMRDVNMAPLSVPVDDKLCYEYADSRLLGTGLVRQVNDGVNRPALPARIYCDDVKDDENRIQKDIEEYMGVGVGNGGTKQKLPADITSSEPVTDFYTEVKKPKKVVPEEEDTEDIVVECPAYVPMEQDTDHAETDMTIPGNDDPETNRNPDHQTQNNDSVSNDISSGDLPSGGDTIIDEEVNNGYFVAGEAFPPSTPVEGSPSPDLYNLALDQDSLDTDAPNLYNLAMYESQSADNADQINQYQLESET